MRSLPVSEASEEDEPTPAEKLALACELFDDALEMMRLRLEREHPTWTDERIEEEIERWLLDRPGAQNGDVAGPHLRVRRP